MGGGAVMHPLFVSALVTLATWGAWRWYIERIWAEPEETAALVLTIAFLGAVGLVRKREPTASFSVPLVPVALLLGAYAVSHAVLPPIARTALAVATALFVLHVAMSRERPPVAFWGLVALALPVVPSLQFTLGYPMRLVSAMLTVAVLQAQGLVIARQGTFLVWRDEMIQFDAPCSGVNMLWAELLLTLMGCVLLRLSILKVTFAVALSVGLAIACNALRAASLFYVEAGLVPQAPAWWHEGIGIAAFMLPVALTVWILTRLRNAEAAACVA
jgi:exosortase/archaeosortase family protein